MEKSNRKKLEQKEEIIFTNKCEVLLDVPYCTLNLAPVQSFANEHGMLPKNEFHVTMLGGKASQKILEKLEKLPVVDRIELRQKIENLVKSFVWEITPSGQFYYLRKEYNDPDPIDSSKTIPETRETVIQLVEVPQLLAFRIAIKELLDMKEEIEVLPHVTIFSNSTREDKKQRGIGIYSRQDLILSSAKKLEVK